MKKTGILLITTLALLAGLLGGCGGEPVQPESDGLQVLCAGAAEYDWTRNILGGNPAGVELTLLVDSGADLHSYQATADDILAISTCDLLVYVGGVSGQWISDALKSAGRADIPVINMLEVLGDRVADEALVPGMEPEAHGDHEHGEAEADEHVWLSLRNAQLLCQAIAGALTVLDSENAAIYQANADAYVQQLEALDVRYTDMVDSAALDTILVADRFPFRYLVDDYGLHYYAAFSGCSAETDASFETVIFLADRLDALALPALLVIDGSNSSIADAVRTNSAGGGQAILTLDSMQSMTLARLDSGESYLSVMEANLVTLTAALNPAG